jgi:hypothetical protein
VLNLSKIQYNVQYLGKFHYRINLSKEIHDWLANKPHQLKKKRIGLFREVATITFQNPEDETLFKLTWL